MMGLVSVEKECENTNSRFYLAEKKPKLRTAKHKDHRYVDWQNSEDMLTTLPRYNDGNGVVRTPAAQTTAASETSSPVRVTRIHKISDVKGI